MWKMALIGCVTLASFGLAVGEAGAMEVLGVVTGISPEKIVCKNKTTEPTQKIRIDENVPAEWNCGELGLLAMPGDTVQVKMVGLVDDVTQVGGTATGFTPTLLVCKNKSMVPQVKVRIENPPVPWNCNHPDFPFADGDRVQMKVRGPADPVEAGGGSLTPPFGGSIETLPPLAVSLTTDQAVVGVGDRVAYLITVANQNPAFGTEVANVVVTYRVPAGLEFDEFEGANPDSNCTGGTSARACSADVEAFWRLGTLVAGESQTIEISASVLSGLADGTLITAPVQVTATELLDTIRVETTVEVQNTQPVQFALSGLHDPVAPDETVTLNVDLGNTSNSAVGNVEAELILPSGVSLSTISDDGEETATGTILWTVGSLAVGEVVHREVDVIVDADAPNGTILLAQGELRHEGGSAVDGVAERVATVFADAPLGVSLTTDQGVVSVGDQVTYLITVANQNPAFGTEVANVVVTYRVPAGLEFDEFEGANPDSNCTGGTSARACSADVEAFWRLGTLVAGESQTIEISASVLSGLADGTLITAPVQITATELLDTIRVETTVAVQ